MQTLKASVGLLGMVVFAAILAVVPTSTAVAGDTNAFRPYTLWHPVPGRFEQSTNGHRVFVPLIPDPNQPVKRIEASKASVITNGITLGQVATNLGSGYASSGLGILTIWWCFADGRVLYVRPRDCSPDEVLISDDEGYGRFWWRTNVGGVIP
jgi:hypothetical protein